MIRVCIAIPTFRRPDYLRVLLTALATLVRPSDAAIVEVLVVDNDPAASARVTVSAAQPTLPFPLRYELVVDAGLSTVRNAILASATGRADMLAMLDDDEVPEPLWLSELLRVAAATRADAVVGPVRAILPSESPRWLRHFRDREYPRFHDGSRLSDGWTSNCLVRLDSVSAAQLLFDPSLNYAGGEDQLFFRQLCATGGTIAYAARAIVREHIPTSRCSLAFTLRRSFRRGNSLAMCDRRLRGIRGRAIRMAKGVALIVLGIVQIVPFTVMGGFSAGVTTLTEIARGAGMLAGLVGLSYEPYRRT